MGTVPVFVHKNININESVAIMIYLCEKYDTIPKTYYGPTIE